MRIETIVESTTTVVDLTDAEAQALRKTGKELTVDATWWGANEADDEEAGDERTAIRVDRDIDGRYRVRVNDAVGLISIGTLQLQVEPKIPLSHFLYLIAKAEDVPRLNDQIAAAETGDPFWKLIIRWYLSELETVLRRDLMRDYQEHHDHLRLFRGRIDPVGTATNYYKGALAIPCEFDEFTIDTPLNRILRAAAAKAASISILPIDLRKRSSNLFRHMEGISPLRTSDLRATTSRTTAHYKSALALARHILEGIGRLPTHGAHLARTFLIRTPKLIEDGIRAVLKEHLSPGHTVRAAKKILTPSSVTINPDLLFDDGLAIGDVKYKIASADWSRSDLYQNIAFASGFHTRYGCVIGFQLDGRPIPRSVDVGATRITYLPWTIAVDLLPDTAASAMSKAVTNWLGGIELDRRRSSQSPAA